jgi:hypothetical protein
MTLTISHRNLEQVRADPRSALAVTSGGGYNRTLALYRSVYDFHRSGSAAAAETSLRNYLEARPRADDDRYLDRFAAYVDAFNASGNSVFSTEQGVKLDLGSGIELGGRINRLDLVEEGGYAAWLFAKAMPLWQQELRMPLLQLFVAESLGVDTRQVSVGFYAFDTAAYAARVFPKGSVDAALSAAQSVAREVAAALATPAP